MNTTSIQATAELLTKALTVPIPALGLDLDGTIDENPLFFGILSRTWPGKVYVITYRNDYAKASDDLAGFGIHYDAIVLVSSFAQKAEKIRELQIGVYFDDMDEVITHIPDSVTVVKVRNGGNFDAGKWLYSPATGKEV